MTAPTLVLPLLNTSFVVDHRRLVLTLNGVSWST